MRSPHVRATRVVVTGTAIAFAAPLAPASIIGDVVDIAHRWPDHSSYWDGPHFVTAAVGTSDATAITPFADHHPGYVVDVEADRIVIDFTDSVSFTAPGTFHGVVIAGIDDAADPSWIITTAVYAPGSSTTGVLTFGPHEVSINWFGTFVGAGTHFEVLLASVPAPGAASLFLAAMPAMLRRRR